MSSSPLAVIDLGSNSSRVVILRADADGALEVLANEHVSLRLIRELNERRRLRAGAQDHAVRLLLDFRHVAAASGALLTGSPETAHQSATPGITRGGRSQRSWAAPARTPSSLRTSAAPPFFIST